MAFCFSCGNQLITSMEKFCSNCGQNLGDRTRKDSIKMSNIQGDILGVGISGSGNIVGKNIVVGSGTISISQQELAKIPIPEYANSLKEFSQVVNQQLQGKQIPEEKVKGINNSLSQLAKEIEDIKPGEEEAKVDYVKQTQIESKTASLLQQVLEVLPEAAEKAATFTPLAPFSKLIGKGVQQIVDAISKRKK